MRFPLTVGLLVACGLAVAAPIPKEKDKPKKDEDAIQGVWLLEKFEGGPALPVPRGLHVRADPARLAIGRDDTDFHAERRLRRQQKGRALGENGRSVVRMNDVGKLVRTRQKELERPTGDALGLRRQVSVMPALQSA